MVRKFCAFALAFLAIGLSLSAAESPRGLSVAADGTLLLAGKPFRGVGVNYFDAFARTLKDSSQTNYEAGFQTLKKHHVPFIRFMGGAYWPVEWGLYQTNRTEYFARFDAFVKTAEKHQIGLIPSLFWHLSTFPDLVGEPCDAWGNTESRTHGFMRAYVREVVLRYRESPAIWGWELGNEFMLAADLPNAAEHRPPIVPTLGTLETRSARDEVTHEQLRVALTEFGKEVRRYDTNRILISGNAFPRLSAWHQKQFRTWEKDSTAQATEMLAGDNPHPLNTISVHVYDNDAERLPLAMAVARKLRKPLFAGEFGVAGATDESRKKFTEMLAAIEKNEVPFAALWVFDYAGQAVDWSVTSENARLYQLEAIGELNRRWSK